LDSRRYAAAFSEQLCAFSLLLLLTAWLVPGCSHGEQLNYEASDDVATVSGWDYSRQRFSLASDSLAGADVDARYPGLVDGCEPPFATVMDELYTRQDALGRVLLGGVEEALCLPRRTLLDLFEGGAGDFGTIRLLSYPGSATDAAIVAGGAPASGTTGIGAHTDFECFTLMHQNAPGLQLMPRVPGVEGAHGEWISAPVRPAEFVVILGDMLERLTNGVLLATPHRVLPTSHPRDSIIRFNAFGPETLVAPLQPFVTPARPAAYSPVVMATHMETTMRNLADGQGSWDGERRRSRSATYDYGGERRVLPV
jgi:isopenicillin N synthase-like dioxygenase